MLKGPLNEGDERVNVLSSTDTEQNALNNQYFLFI